MALPAWDPGSPGDEPQFTSDVRKSDAKVRLAALAGRQRGRVRYDQLRTLGIGHATIKRWRDSGYLHPELPRVYAVGHAAKSTESDLSAALLYAGPGAELSHGTAIWWLDLLKYPPPQIHLSTPRRVRSLDGIVVHRERHLDRVIHKGFPVTTHSQAILDFAATGPPDLLRLVLANADYDDLLDIEELQSMMGRGVDGTVALRGALEIHLPELARTRSDLEKLLLHLCQTQQLPIPHINKYIGPHLVDAYWPKHMLVVEVDGWRGHRTRAQRERDYRKDLELRASGLRVNRYTWHQCQDTPADVAADLRREGL
jgi:very-short-patch-repair endonuclease